MNPSSKLPNYRPSLPILKKFFIKHVKRAVVMGGSLYSSLPQHFVHEVLPLVDIVYDRLLADPELHVVVEGSDVVPWLLAAMPC